MFSFPLSPLKRRRLAQVVMVSGVFGAMGQDDKSLFQVRCQEPFQESFAHGYPGVEAGVSHVIGKIRARSLIVILSFHILSHRLRR
jgi:hypothetical protein